MAMKDKIRIRRDMELKFVHDSNVLSNDDKINLTGIISEAAECTNGLSEVEKVQHLSETTFGITTMISRITEELTKNTILTHNLSEKMDKVVEKVETLAEKVGNLEPKPETPPPEKRIEDLNWKDTLKLILVKPWIWIFASVVCFSPKGIELIQVLLAHFGT